MHDSGASIAETSPEAIVAGVEARARRFETPCGDGTMVWRAWGSGPPVMLMHGAHGAWSHWIRNIDALASWRTVWAPDIPGFGDSAIPTRPDDGASFAEALADGLRLLLAEQVPIDLVGFSTGGVLAAHLAVLAPELIRRLILVDVGGLDTPSALPPRFKIRGLTGEALAQAHRGNLMALMLRNPESLDALALHLQHINTPRGRVYPGPLVMPDKLLPLLPQLKPQLDAIWAEFDAAHPDADLQLRVLRGFKPDCEMKVIRGAGHWCLYEDAPAFNAALRELLETPLRV
jgi:pimeloyl-ACP methyl ester carboxylesterase